MYLYPNPSNAFINIITSNDQPIEKVNVVSIDGKLFRSLRYDNFDNRHVILPISNYPDGVHVALVQLFNGQRISSTFRVKR